LQSVNQAILDSMECTCVAPICVNVTCTLVKLDEKRSNMTLGGTITKKLKFMKFRIRRRTQTKTKQWGNVELDFTLDYCDFAKGADNPVVNMFVPGIRQAMGDSLRPCPYQGTFLVNYITDPGKKVVDRPVGTLVKLEVLFVTINSQLFFKITMITKSQSFPK
jgi:hypothetical protein